jgi:DNA polymerase bacteriophage-type
MGGVSGYQTFARAYGVRMADYWDVIQQMIDPAHVAKAKENLKSWGRSQVESLEITELEWVASETCKLAWRARHPATVRFWYGLQDAAKNAIRDWGRVFHVGEHIRLKGMTHQGQRWLCVKLPSGRYLTYFDPQLVNENGDAIRQPGAYTADQLRRTSITYMGEAAEEGKTTRQWVRVWTHGGKMTGNVCQTLARDILAPALQTAEDRGYTPILTVHDEVLTEVPDHPDYDAQGLAEILATNPPWSGGLPLAAAAFEARRYKKD